MKRARDRVELHDIDDGNVLAELGDDGSIAADLGKLALSWRRVACGTGIEVVVATAGLSVVVDRVFTFGFLEASVRQTIVNPAFLA